MTIQYNSRVCLNVLSLLEAIFVSDVLWSTLELFFGLFFLHKMLHAKQHQQKYKASRFHSQNLAVKTSQIHFGSFKMVGRKLHPRYHGGYVPRHYTYYIHI